MSAASQFVKDLGARVATEFGGDVEYKKSKLLLQWSGPFAGCYVQFSGANKWSPHISLAFYFGRRFPEASAIAKRFGDSDAGQIWQYSLNVNHMKGLGGSPTGRWEIDITKPPTGLEAEIAKSIRQVAIPFWQRYPTARSARDALAEKDPWCIWAGGPFFRSLLYLDAALGDLNHFEAWMPQLELFYRNQASDELQRVRAAPAHAI